MKRPSSQILQGPPGRLITVDAMSDVGNQFVALALVDWLVFKGSQPLINLVLLCLIHQAPSILLSPLAGKGIDRLGARTWLIMINAVKCVLVAALVAATGTRFIFVLYLGFVTASLFFSIGRQSLAPLLISRDRLVRFNALNERIAIGVGIVSPWLIGLTLARSLPGTAQILTMLIFFGSVLVLTGLPASGRPPGRTADPAVSSLSDNISPGRLTAERLPESPPDDRDNITGRRFGSHADRPGGRLEVFFSPFKDNSKLSVYFLMLGFVIFGGGILNLGLPLFFKTTLNGDIASWGLILSASQGGAFLSTLLLPRWSPALRQGTLPAVVFLMLGAALFLLPFTFSYLQVVALMGILGFGLTMLQVFWETRIQQNTELPSMGRTMALLSSYQGVCYLSTILIGAAISAFWSTDLFFMIGAMVLGSAVFIVKRA